MMKAIVAALAVTGALLLGACQEDATIASQNLTKAADNFEIMRRVVFYNSIADKVIMVTEGKCSVTPHELRTAVICKVGPNSFIRNFYGKSDNTVYFLEQMAPVKASVYHYRRTFKPQQFLPDIDFRGSGQGFVEALTPDSSD